jgi:NitT/TauT family transport system permease protein
VIAPVRHVGKGLCGVAGAVALWELLRQVGVLPSDLAPSFVDIVPALVRETFSGSLGAALLESVRAWAAGTAVTLLIGLPVGVLIGLSRWMDALTSLVFDFLRPVPAVAFVPVAVIFFGLGTKMQTFLIAMAAVWPVIFNTRFGVRSVDPLLLDNARAMGLGRLAQIRRVTLPASLPGMFTGVRTAAAIAVVLTIVSELVASGTGIGGFINDAQNNDLPADAFAGVVMAGLFGYAVYLLVDAVEGRVLRWHRLSGEGSGR